MTDNTKVTSYGTFCVFPWTQIIVRSDGAPQACNRIVERIRESGRTMSVQHDSFDEIWNGVEMRELRRLMVEEKTVPACHECNSCLSMGAIPMRDSINKVWQKGFLNREHRTIDDLKMDAIGSDFHIAHGPRLLQLDIGSLCNLKCRMCNSGASSRINHDPVHRKWTGSAPDFVSNPSLWFKKLSTIKEILHFSEDLCQLHIIGGEPFLIPEVQDVLTTVINTGVAHQIELSMHTNGTRVNAPWFDLLNEFKHVVFYLSVDGFGADYEYIRYPAKWNTIVRNLDILRTLANTEVRAHVVVQSYNVLRIVNLFEYFDMIGIMYSPHLLNSPAYLGVEVLPQEARLVAAARLRSYAESTGCKEEVHPTILGLANYLEYCQGASVETLYEFMVFTNDLDLSRNQNFAGTHNELLDFIERTGLLWTNETRHVFPRSIIFD